MNSKVKYLVITPTYNEAENVEPFISAVLAVPGEVDILIVDDNSPDKTAQKIKDLRFKIEEWRDRVYILERKGKLGLGTAYADGFVWAKKRNYDFVVSMDADFSHEPKDLPRLLNADKNVDIVTGSRYIKGGKVVGWNLWRYLNSHFANIIVRIALGLPLKDATAGFKRYSKKAVDYLLTQKLVASGYAFQVETVFLGKQACLTMSEVPITFVDRRAGESKIAGEIKKSVKIVWQLFIRRKSVRQLAKFSVVGLGNFIFDSSIYVFETRVFKIGAIAAKTISFIASATSSYYFNRKWTFRSTHKNITKQYIKFILVAAIGLGVNVVVFYISHSIFHIYDLISLVNAAAVTTIWNFTANKWWTFKH